MRCTTAIDRSIMLRCALLLFDERWRDTKPPFRYQDSVISKHPLTALKRVDPCANIRAEADRTRLRHEYHPLATDRADACTQ